MAKAPEKKSATSVEPKLIRELASILRDSGLSEIEIEHGDLRLRLAAAVSAAAVAPTQIIAAPVNTHVVAPALPAPAAPPAMTPANHPGAVLSPMVGTAYLQPEPGAPAFVMVGDRVSEGQTLLMVEAMKTFNPIPAPRAGRLVELLVSNAQPVEFGQALAIIE